MSFCSATCRCFKNLTTNYWNYPPYTNISRKNLAGGFFPYFLNVVTLACCQTCLEHGNSEVNYVQDGEGNVALKLSDIAVKRSITQNTDFSFPVHGFKGQTAYIRIYGFASIVETVGTVFFALKPDYSSISSKALFESIMIIFPFLAITVILASMAGIIMWALVSHKNNITLSKLSLLLGETLGNIIYVLLNLCGLYC